MMAGVRHLAIRINNAVSKRFLLVVVVGFGTGLALPDSVGELSWILPYVLVFIVFAMGTSCTVESFRAIALSPKGFLTAVAMVYAVMPLIGFAMGHFSYPGRPQLQLGHFLIAVTPVAITSVVWTGIAAGNVTLSLALVTLITLLSGFWIPAAMALYMGAVVDFDAAELVASLLKSVVLPALAGLVARNRAPRHVETVRPYLDLVSKAGVITVLVVNGAALGPMVGDISWEMGGVLLLVALHVMLNFSLSFGAARLILGRRSSSVASVTYSSSMRNNAAGLVIAANYFGPLAALPVIACILVQHFWAGVFLRLVKVQAPQ